MKVQITTDSLDAEYVNASTSSDIVKTEKNQRIILQQKRVSASTKLEYQNTIVSITQDPKLYGIIYSS
jgi:hypothetical protein